MHLGGGNYRPRPGEKAGLKLPGKGGYEQGRL